MSCCWPGGHTWRAHALSDLSCFVTQINYVWPPIARCSVGLLWTQPFPSMESGSESLQLSGKSKWGEAWTMQPTWVSKGQLPANHQSGICIDPDVLLCCHSPFSRLCPWGTIPHMKGIYKVKVLKWWKRVEVRQNTCLASFSFLEFLLLLLSFCCCCCCFVFALFLNRTQSLVGSHNLHYSGSGLLPAVVYFIKICPPPPNTQN